MSRGKLIAADQKAINDYIERALRDAYSTEVLPDGSKARVLEKMYYPGGVHGTRPQMLVTLAPMAREI